MLVLDSYAHHPTELAADLRAARDIRMTAGSSRSSSRTCSAGPGSSPAEFGAALGLADEVFVLDVYAAREDPEPGVTGELVASAVPGGRAVFASGRDGAPGRDELPAAVAGMRGPVIWCSPWARAI